MSAILNDEAVDLLFRSARTHSKWLDKPVSDETLRQLYDLMKWGPTSFNTSPARIIFVRTPEGKERLRPALSAGNVDKTMAAPVTAIIGYDAAFYDFLPKLAPQAPNARDIFANAPEMSADAAFRNGSLQGGYFILAARALGLDCGPMSGFDNAKVDELFFGADSPFAGRPVKSNFLCNLGYGDIEKVYPRAPRLDFDEACALV